MRKKYKIIIGCSVLLAILVIVGLFCYFNHKNNTNAQLENNIKERKVKTSKENKTKDNTDNEKVTSNVDNKEENVTKENAVSSSSNNQKETKKSNTSTSTNSAVKKSNTSNNTKNNQTQNYSTNNSSQNNSQNSQKNPSTDKTPTQPEKDPNAVDTTDPLYPSHHGIINYSTLNECNDAGFDKSFDDPNIFSFSCIEVHSNAGNILGYYLEIRYN